MKTSKRSLVIALVTATACFALGGQNASAQMNEKKVERKASGNYDGRLFGATKVYTDPDPLHSYSGTPADSAGTAKVPIGKKRPSSTSVDSTGVAAATTGKEQKSKVARNGKKIKLAAKEGAVSTAGDSYGPISGGTAQGTTKLKGKKWKLSAFLTGGRLEGPGTASYTTMAEGQN